MVTIVAKRGLFKERLSYFATEKEIQLLVSELSWNEIIRFRHISFDIPHSKRMVYKGILTTWCIDLTKDIEQIFREMNKTTRREIRRAEDILSDIKIRMNDDTAQKDFFILYNNFVKQKGHTYQLSLNRYNEYLKVSDVFVLYFKGKPFAASLDMPDYSTKRVYGLFLGSARFNNQEDAKISSFLNRYMYWHEIQTYKAKGFEIYDFGGIAETGSRAWFKKSFGGSLFEEYYYIFAGSMITYLLGKASLRSLNLIMKIRISYSKMFAR